MTPKLPDSLKEVIQNAVGVATIFVVAILLSPLIRQFLTTQAAVSRANLVVNTVLSALLLFVYADISSAEKEQSEQIESQVKVMQDQLEVAHSPQIAVDYSSFSKNGHFLRLSNVGNGPATGIEFDVDLEIEGESELELDVFWINRGVDDGYLEAGDSGEFTYSPDLSIRDSDKTIYRGGLVGAAKQLQERGIDHLHWKSTISFDTVLGKSRDIELFSSVVGVSSLL